ncbi:MULTISPECIES: hypothetical protein [Staphylococcus]|uniref:aggregation-promoting factor C-terminal-like domain-containing protein n=1 Tax=Staphylococcus TaxID=1279 RepID=UPI000D1D8628|nr:MULTISPECIES: hypothetical protein [Staphylococcus]PTK68338.1 hypothetical protein BUZ28_01150 [Staphylococcus borealis]RIO70474.1 hypothetical protein BUZ17_07510 [Staphylococcus borealis]
MKKSIFTLMTMVSLGAAGLQSGQAHASEMTHSQQHQSCQYNQHTQLQHTQPSQQGQYSNVASAATTTSNTTDTSSENTASTSNTTASSDESSSSVYKQFIAAGGTQELWEKIVLPESGGDPNASNGQYHGLGQTNQSWGYGSVETQTKGMISYAKERYGSIEAAISFRESNGWW